MTEDNREEDRIHIEGNVSHDPQAQIAFPFTDFCRISSIGVSGVLYWPCGYRFISIRRDLAGALQRYGDLP